MLCFGGSFNPIHHGHLICARAVAECLGVDRITLIPSGQPPHKAGQIDMASATDRLAMCRAAVPRDAMFDVSTIETDRPGPSFTIDTVRRLVADGAGPVAWLIGADMLNQLPQWHQPEALMREAMLFIMARPGFEMDWSALAEAFHPLRRRIVVAPRIDISATEIRRRVINDLPIDYLVPEPVGRYIRENGLYRPTARTISS